MALVSLAVVVAMVGKIVHERRHPCRLRLATGGRGTEYYAFGEAHRAFREGRVDAVFHTIALGRTAKDYIGRSLAQGAKLLAIDQVEALRSLHPFLEPATIPRGFYAGHPALPARHIPTAAVRAVLLVRSRIPESVVRRITRILYEHRNEIVTENPLASEIRRPDKPEEGLFPLHAGAQAYYSREKPRLWVSYADPLALCLSLLVLCASGVWHLRLRLEERQKNRADLYNMEILGLIKQIRRSENLRDLQEVRQKLFDIFSRVLLDLDKDRVTTESFQLFAFPWDVAIGAIRHRELTLRHQSPTDDPDEEDDEEEAVGT